MDPEETARILNARRAYYSNKAIQSILTKTPGFYVVEITDHGDNKSISYEGLGPLPAEAIQDFLAIINGQVAANHTGRYEQ